MPSGLTPALPEKTPSTSYSASGTKATGSRFQCTRSLHQTQKLIPAKVSRNHFRVKLEALLSSAGVHLEVT